MSTTLRPASLIRRFMKLRRTRAVIFSLYIMKRSVPLLFISEIIFVEKRFALIVRIGVFPLGA